MKRILLAIVMLFNITIAIAQSGKSVLWQVTGNRIKQPVYLVGTIHLYDTLQYELPKPIFDRLKEVKTAYFELDFGHIDPRAMLKDLWITDSTQYLDKLLDTLAFSKLRKIASSSPILSTMGDRLYQMKPIYVSVFLMSGKNITSIDMELYKKAVSLKETVGGLETMDEQLKAIGTISVAEQGKMLTQMLAGSISVDSMLSSIVSVYVRQDVDNMVADLGKTMPLDPNANDELIDKRNLIMADRAANLINEGSIMIAVGAGHLGGEKGLINLLRKKGYTLKPIIFAFQKKQGR